jgi:hypothetical protein
LETDLAVELPVQLYPEVGGQEGRGLGFVWIRIVYPDKKLIVFVPGKPRIDFFINLLSVEIPSFCRNGIFIEIKAMIKVEFRLQHSKRDKSSGSVSFILEYLSQRD